MKYEKAPVHNVRAAASATKLNARHRATETTEGPQRRAVTEVIWKGPP